MNRTSKLGKERQWDGISYGILDVWCLLGVSLALQVYVGVLLCWFYNVFLVYTSIVKHCSSLPALTSTKYVTSSTLKVALDLWHYI